MDKQSIFEGKPITYQINEKDEIEFIIDDEKIVATVDLEEVVQEFINNNYYK